jgi:hypothetical protein
MVRRHLTIWYDCSMVVAWTTFHSETQRHENRAKAQRVPWTGLCYKGISNLVSRSCCRKLKPCTPLKQSPISKVLFGYAVLGLERGPFQPDGLNGASRWARPRMGVQLHRPKIEVGPSWCRFFHRPGLKTSLALPGLESHLNAAHANEI